MQFQALSDEELIQAYLDARDHNLDRSFLKMLFDEIIERDLSDLLLETYISTRSI